MRDSVAVVIPAFNEAQSIGDVVRRVPDSVCGARTAVLVVDDGSSDSTADAARAAGAEVARHESNLGGGAAIRTGYDAARQAGARLIVTLDADGQHAPADAPRLLDPLLAGRADLVIGARRRDPRRMPPHRRLSNWLSSALVSRALRAPLPDSQCGFRAMTPAVAAAVTPSGARYEFETEFLFLAAARGFRLAAVDIPTVYDGSPSHFRLVGDTLRLSRVFLRHWRAILWGGERSRTA